MNTSLAYINMLIAQCISNNTQMTSHLWEDANIFFLQIINFF